MIVYSSETTAPKPPQNQASLWIVSFGSDRDYVSIAKDTISQLQKLYPYANCLIYEPSDLPDYIRDYAKLYKVGYGYWLWKPWLVHKTLQTMDMGDVLLYVDGRCGVPRRSVSWLDSLYNQDANQAENIEFVAWMMNEVEYKWTTGDLFDKFGLSVESPDASSGQFAGGIFALQLTSKTIDFITNWYCFMKDNLELCRDEVSQIANHANFLNNRHDQSVFSLMLKKHSGQGLRLRTLTQKNIQNSRSITPHGKPHPSEPQKHIAIRFLKNLLKRMLSI